MFVARTALFSAGDVEVLMAVSGVTSGAARLVGVLMASDKKERTGSGSKELKELKELEGAQTS